MKQKFKIQTTNVQWSILIHNAFYIQKQCILPTFVTETLNHPPNILHTWPMKNPSYKQDQSWYINFQIWTKNLNKWSCLETKIHDLTCVNSKNIWIHKYIFCNWSNNINTNYKYFQCEAYNITLDTHIQPQTILSTIPNTFQKRMISF